jgi:hypothetical protein
MLALQFPLLTMTNALWVLCEDLLSDLGDVAVTRGFRVNQEGQRVDVIGQINAHVSVEEFIDFEIATRRLVDFAKNWDRIVKEGKTSMCARVGREMPEFLGEFNRGNRRARPNIQEHLDFQAGHSHAVEFRFAGGIFQEIRDALEEIREAFRKIVHVEGLRAPFVDKDQLETELVRIAGLFDDRIQERIRLETGIPRAGAYVEQFSPNNVKSLMLLAKLVHEERIEEEADEAAIAQLENS